MTLLASQSLLALKDVNLSNREKQLIKRELSTELSIFFDYVKKQVTVGSHDLADKNVTFYRRNYGLIPLKNNNNNGNDGDDPDFDGDSSFTQPSAAQQRNRSNQQSDILRKSMRVQLVKKLHSQKTPPIASKNEFNLTRNISPIGVSTPKKSNLNLPSSTPIDRDMGAAENNNEIRMFEPIEPTFTGLSMIKLVDKDYLHLMSNLFQHIICQND